jgi:hypothetical protein
MKQLAILTFSLLLFSCSNTEKSNSTNTNEVELLKKENELLKKQMEVDSLKNKISLESRTQDKSENKSLASANNELKQTTNESVNLIRTGKHQIILQWLDENPSGSVSISKLSDNKYKIEGGQESRTNSDYLIINGTLTPINKNELVFDGTLIYKVEISNSGLPCDKSGRHIFKSTQNRKYWRMQEMTNCDGILTDYVDIFF